ncbi:hypothetical protein B0O80DRAFT_76722 [Mortierella sp. GBAus27b]|nr:hypothetical protein B0O80DRAFT_76722 [Mortierella sp. GBAus27b]
MTVQPYTALRQVELPKDDTIVTPELKPSRPQNETQTPSSPVGARESGQEPAEDVPVDPTPQVPSENSATGALESQSMDGTVDQLDLPAPVSTAVATEAMEVETTPSVALQMMSNPLVSEDSEMTDIINAASNVQHEEQQVSTETETPTLATPLDTAVVQDLQPVVQDLQPAVQDLQPVVTSAPETEQPLLSADVVMAEDQQNPPADQAQEPVAIAPIDIPTSTPPTTLPPAESSAPETSESPAPVPLSTVSTNEQVHFDALPETEIHEPAPEMDVQETFTSSVFVDGYATTANTQIITTSTDELDYVTTANTQIITTSTDESGTTEMDTTQTETTTINYAEAPQEQFFEETGYQHIVEETRPAQIEEIPEPAEVMPSITSAELPSTTPEIVDASAAPAPTPAPAAPLPTAVSEAMGFPPQDQDHSMEQFSESLVDAPIPAPVQEPFPDPASALVPEDPSAGAL